MTTNNTPRTRTRKPADGEVRIIRPADAAPEASGTDPQLAADPQPVASGVDASDAAMDAAQAAQAADPMELAKQRRAERIAEAKAAKAAAAKVMDSLIKPVESEPITKKPDWNLDLVVACNEAPEPIRLQDSFKGSYLDKEAKLRYFFRTPEILRLRLSIEENLAGVKITGETKKQRNDPMLKLVRNWIAANLIHLKGDGAELISLIDDFTIEEPVRQATLGWASELVGPQSILNQVSLQSGRYALLNPVTGKVKLVRDFYAKPKA